MSSLVQKTKREQEFFRGDVVIVSFNKFDVNGNVSRDSATAIVLRTSHDVFNNGDTNSYELLEVLSDGGYKPIKWINEGKMIHDPAPEIDGLQIIKEYEGIE
jgi:hypothetical protein